MRIAVAYDNGNVLSPFSDTKSFKLYELEGKDIVRNVIVPVWGEEESSVSECLRQYRADVLICGGISGKTRAALGAAGIVTFPGVIGAADTAVSAFLNGTLTATPDGKCASDDCNGHCKSCKDGCPHSAGCNSKS